MDHVWFAEISATFSSVSEMKRELHAQPCSQSLWAMLASQDLGARLPGGKPWRMWVTQTPFANEKPLFVLRFSATEE
jgi:hypothetical protein